MKTSGLAILLGRASKRVSAKKPEPKDESFTKTDNEKALVSALRSLQTAKSDKELLSAWRAAKGFDLDDDEEQEDNCEE